MRSEISYVGDLGNLGRSQQFLMLEREKFG